MTSQKESADVYVHMFLLADAVGCALPSQNTPQRSYNIERMLKSIIAKSGKVKVCGSCVDARGIHTLTRLEGVETSSMSELGQWSLNSERIFTF